MCCGNFVHKTILNKHNTWKKIENDESVLILLYKQLNLC